MLPIFAVLNQPANAAGPDTTRSVSPITVSDTNEKNERELSPKIKKTTEQERLLKKLDLLRADYTERVRKRGPDGKPLVDSSGKPVMPFSSRGYTFRLDRLIPDAGLDGFLPGSFNSMKKADGTIEVWAGQYEHYAVSFGEVHLTIMRGNYEAAEKMLQFLESYIKTLKQ